MPEQPKLMMVYAVPSDAAVLAAIGAVAVRHGQLDHALRMVIKSLASVPVNVALDATERTGSAELRDRIKKLARKRLGEGSALVRLQAIITRAGRATQRRNDLLYGIWAQEIDGEGFVLGEGRSRSAMPEARDLEALALDLAAIADELHGFLKETLDRTPPV